MTLKSISEIRTNAQRNMSVPTNILTSFIFFSLEITVWNSISFGQMSKPSTLITDYFILNSKGTVWTVVENIHSMNLVIEGAVLLHILPLPACKKA